MGKAAHDIAQQIAIDVTGPTACSVIVVDDEGAEIYAAPIKAVPDGDI